MRMPARFTRRRELSRSSELDTVHTQESGMKAFQSIVSTMFLRCIRQLTNKGSCQEPTCGNPGHAELGSDTASMAVHPGYC